MIEKTTYQLTGTPGDLTLGTLRDFAESLIHDKGVPLDAKVKVRTEYADRPGEMGQFTLTVTD